MADHVPNLGHAPGDDARRDAVHVAVAPVTAATCLDPGDRVGLLVGKEFGSLEGQATVMEAAIGIVDPFHRGRIKQGQRFWLFLFPNTVTGLRHAWSHPAFAPKAPASKGES